MTDNKILRQANVIKAVGLGMSKQDRYILAQAVNIEKLNGDHEDKKKIQMQYDSLKKLIQ